MASGKTRTALSSLVRTTYGNLTAPEPGTTVKTRHGDMIVGPEYEHFRAVEQRFDTVNKLLHDIAMLEVSRAEALSVLRSIDIGAIASGEMCRGLTCLLGLLEGRVESDPARRYEQLTALRTAISSLSEFEFSVSMAAGTVPRPPDPLAIHPAKGQPLGTGAYHRSLND